MNPNQLNHRAVKAKPCLDSTSEGIDSVFVIVVTVAIPIATPVATIMIPNSVPIHAAPLQTALSRC